MNALKEAIVARIEADPDLQTLCNASPAPVYDKLAFQADQATPITYPYIILSLRPAAPLYHMKGTAAKFFQFLLKAIDRGDSSERAGAIDERLTELFHPLEPLPVVGHNTGFQGRGVGVDFTETSAGVKYQHVGAIFRITLIPI